MKVIISWSGGKDSCLALYRTKQAGHEPVCLLNFVSEKYGRCCFHGVPAGLIKAQSDALGIPLVQKSVPDTMEGYETAFKQSVSELKDRFGAEGMVFGDIYLDEHKDWVERVCKDIGIKAIEPLWNQETEKLVAEFIDAGFETMIVSANASLLPKEIIGRNINGETLNIIRSKNVCVCGENGEFHTFVFDGPNFSKCIEITESETVLREGFWKHWFLDIKDFRLEAKDAQ
ncbi:MAG: diphthine--ammonia ligase [Elusimicrobia bacterium]|nr:diphthine--ammonia ligase [Elusimicrobiota bacterium]